MGEEVEKKTPELSNLVSIAINVFAALQKGMAEVRRARRVAPERRWLCLFLFRN